jgi:hypothetical protein
MVDITRNYPPLPLPGGDYGPLLFFHEEINLPYLYRFSVS